VGGDLFAKPALELIARKVAATSGDARRVLEMAASCIQKCIDTSTDTELNRSFDPDDPISLVKMKHVMQFVRDTNRKLTDSIVALPQAAQVVLCVAVTVSAFMTATSHITQGNLLRFCRGAATTGILSDITVPDFMDIIKSLSDAALLKVGDDNEIESFLNKETPLTIGVQLVEVECALNTTLLQEPYYAKLAEFVKENF
jgi:cell division control protein 6